MKFQYIQLGLVARGAVLKVQYPEWMTDMDLRRAISAELGHTNWEFVEQLCHHTITINHQ